MIMILRSINTTKLPEILEYCRNLEEFQRAIGIPPADRLERFCIGFYQLNGAIGWKNTPCESESYMSAMIHFLVVMESLKFPAEQWLPADLLDLERVIPNWEKMMLRSSKAMQNLFYARQAGKTIRSARYSPKQLEADLAMLIRSCITGVATNQRQPALYHATEILASKV